MAVTPIIIQDGSGRLFALGLEWKRIVVSASGAAAEQAGYETAHKAGSNRLVFSKDSKGGVTGVGHAKFAKSDFDALSLARAFALRHDAQDRAIIALTIEPGQVWVCATSDGRQRLRFACSPGYQGKVQVQQGFSEGEGKERLL